MTYYLRNGAMFNIVEEANIDIHETLPAALFKICLNPRTEELYLEDMPDFVIPDKLYGDVAPRTERVLNTYRSRSGSTGVFLTGEKGSGKTLLAKNLAMEAMKVGIPTIIVDKPFPGDKFNKFIQLIDQECIVVFDEFEKTFDQRSQQHMLTLLDGVYNTKKLFILTSNDKYGIDRHMQNRPGRLFYRFEYTGLSEDYIREFCADANVTPDHIDKIVQICELYNTFTFDMLQALVEEMGRYNENPAEALRYLNISPSSDMGRVYNLSIEGLPGADAMDETWSGNPLEFAYDLYLSHYLEEDKLEKLLGPDKVQVKYRPSDLASADITKGLFRFTQNGITMVLTKQERFIKEYYMDNFERVSAM